MQNAGNPDSAESLALTEVFLSLGIPQGSTLGLDLCESVLREFNEHFRCDVETLIEAVKSLLKSQ